MVRRNRCLFHRYSVAHPNTLGPHRFFVCRPRLHSPAQGCNRACFDIWLNNSRRNPHRFPFRSVWSLCNWVPDTVHFGISRFGSLHSACIVDSPRTAQHRNPRNRGPFHRCFWCYPNTLAWHTPTGHRPDWCSPRGFCTHDRLNRRNRGRRNRCRLHPRLEHHPNRWKARTFLRNKVDFGSPFLPRSADRPRKRLDSFRHNLYRLRFRPGFHFHRG